MTHPRSLPLLAAFRAQAARTPHATALIIGDTSLSYRALDDASAGLATLLRRNGTRPGSSVCVRLEQSALAVVAVLAALRVGAAWAALEPDLPPTRLRALLNDTDCAVVLATRDDRDVTALRDAPPVLAADDLDIAALAAAGAQAGPPADVPESAPAYLIYTSGSTGVPKGVLVSRGQLADSVAPRGAVYGSEPSLFLMAMRLSFDGMLAGMFWAFGGGHTLLLPTARQLRLAPELAALARAHHATHLVVVPSYYRRLLAEPGQLPDSLRLVVVAGEVCTPELVRTHRERLPGARLANEYGPTETVVSCVVEADPDPAAERIPIGRPWPGATAHVLDERLRPVPDGATGELYIGGAYVAIGYARAPGRTAERFVADPFGPPGARLYRTGDLARRDERGALHYHGRTDHQVKIRGARVELGEVEAAIEAHPAVDQAVVVRADTGGEAPRLIAFLTAAAGHVPPDARELRRHCRGFLVEQALPGRFVPMERMPLSPMGKADRAALAALVPAEPPGGARPPGQERWSGHQRAVWDMWADVLGHRDVGLEDNFFGVGGNSLKIVDLYSRLDERWPGVVRAGELFDLITVAAQAGAITERVGPEPADAAGPPDPGPGERQGPQGPPTPARPAPVAYEL
ncbi:non-ribosomal peptide synthetase [Streptomyces sp. PT12]|uniref:non-ribosomal peptide synthetase n=1 Tax=Streptomyces sp. PT12 TaxID=1510197 RepID=UPI000DE55A9B|nr:non-ribosomal peptide synthetase [Streptomyces sp. PT12]RBM10742.1 peptide synthetase [Streptomyces sp. PT12]